MGPPALARWKPSKRRTKTPPVQSDQMDRSSIYQARETPNLFRNRMELLGRIGQSR